MNNRSEETRIITSHEKIKEAFDAFFAEKSAMLIHSGKEIKIKCKGCMNGKAIIGIPYETSIPEPVVIYTVAGNRTIHLFMKKSAKISPENTMFEIIKCSLTHAARSSCRHRITHDREKSGVVYITDFITDAIVGNSLSFGSRRINAVFAQAETELKKHFSSVRFVTKNEAPNDLRMQYISEHKKSIIIRRVDDPNPHDRGGYDFYMNNIFSAEKSEKMRKLSYSEAVLPLYYRNKYPYGYLRLEKDSTLKEGDLKIAEKFVKSIEQYLVKNDIFPVVNDRILVHEISSAGLSVLQHEKKNARHFKVGNQFCYDLVIPGNKKVHILATIKHNSPLGNGIIRTGFEIEKIDDSSVGDFKVFVGSLED